MKIIAYRRNDDIDVEFQDEYHYVKNTTYTNFKRGNVKNPYDKDLFGIGYLGVGKYKCKRDNEDNLSEVYETWMGMLRRCYFDDTKFPAYYDRCIVCDEWHNFQNFAQWYDNNYYEIENEKMCLDKDILIKGNKIYSPDTCVFVPQSINSLFIKSDKARGDLPIGVTKEHKKYSAQCCNTLGIKRRIGIYNTSEEAFLAYKEAKEETIKMIADHYKNLIPEKLYNAMYEYEVNIND